ncbi:MAG: histidine--tRNA ligase [Treponema sp.]|nr:MAG: histidine--tRNA ligase [Treponema sp.]
MSNLIQARVLKGFRDFLPADEIERVLLTEKLTGVFRRFGFLPIDTPVLEFSEILLRKSNGETEKQVFRFEDNGGRDVALRFDLTVPFARFIAEHRSEICFPFKRYHIAKVWRGEKPQAGRYREFIQCDFDIVGSDTASADFEILNIIQKSFENISKADIQIHVSHRGIFNRFLEKLGIKDNSEEVLRIVDKLGKIGEIEVLSLLSRITENKNAQAILNYISLGRTAGKLQSSDFLSTLESVEKMIGGECEETNRLREIYEIISGVGIQDYFVFDTSITRGLDYYTGIVYETFLTKLPSIGSVCSGGRYDNLTGLYMKEAVSGVGASIGLDRLIAGLNELEKTDKKSGFTDAVIFFSEKSNPVLNYGIADYLAKQGLSVEVYTENKKMNAQYTWAENKSITWGIFIQENTEAKHFPSNTKVKLKNLKTRAEYKVLVSDVINKIKDCNK